MTRENPLSNRHVVRVGAPSLFCLLSAAPVAAQALPRDIAITPAVRCGTCQIVVIPEVILGDTAGPGELPKPVYWVRRDALGRYYLSFAPAVPPMIFDPRGQYLGSVGGIGDGPGEARMPLVFHASGDSVWVADPANARLSLFRLDLPKARFLGSWRQSGLVPPPFSAVPMAGEAVLVNSTIAAQDRIGYPLHLLRTDGSIHSFGSSAPEYRPGLPRLNMRLLAPARNGGAWVAHSTRYQVERYDAQGHLLARWTRAVPWFPANRGEVPADVELPPEPRVIAVAEDERGLVWILLLVPDPRHREAFGPDPHPSPPGRPQILVMEDENLYFDTVVEVFDPAAGRILASTRVDPSMVTLLGPKGGGMLAASHAPSPHGGYQIVVRLLRAEGLAQLQRRQYF